MELLNQPFTGQLGSRLIELLNTRDYHTLNIAVAFAKNSGVLRIKDSLKFFREQGGKVNAYVGVDLGGTSFEALTALRLHCDSLNVVHSEKGQTFHVKTYQLLGNDKGLIIVGSHNLTGGGLWTNFESSVFIPIDTSAAGEAPISKTLNNYFKELISLDKSFMSIGAQDDIDMLLRNGYVVKEVAEQVRLAKASRQNGPRERLFGNGVPADLPPVRKPKKEREKQKETTGPSAQASPNSAHLSDEGDTIWFETRRMTGGSRNILDLSMKSLIETGDPAGTSFDLGERKFMRGGVEFFGLNATAADQKKDITLNFEGVDYTGNTILFPDGEKANGTWRIQIKGVSPSGEKITDAIRAKGMGDYLVAKVITFTKVNGDYYFMSVFPEAELEGFKAASRILARNGSTQSAKLLGVL